MLNGEMKANQKQKSTPNRLLIHTYSSLTRKLRHRVCILKEHFFIYLFIYLDHGFSTGAVLTIRDNKNLIFEIGNVFTFLKKDFINWRQWLPNKKPCHKANFKDCRCTCALAVFFFLFFG